MAFENIDPSQLKSALNSCKSSINHNITDELINSILSVNVWANDSKQKLSNAFSELSNLYKDLESEISSGIAVASLTEQYKNFENKNINLQRQIDDLEPQQYYLEYYSEEYKNEKGELELRHWSETVEDKYVTEQITSKQNEIYQNKIYMDRIKGDVANLL